MVYPGMTGCVTIHDGFRAINCNATLGACSTRCNEPDTSIPEYDTKVTMDRAVVTIELGTFPQLGRTATVTPSHATHAILNF